MDTLCDIEGCTGFSCPDCGRCTAECPNMRCARGQLMRLLIVDEDGAVMQEYEGVTAQVDGMDLTGNVVKVVIPGEAS